MRKFPDFLLPTLAAFDMLASKHIERGERGQ